MNKTQIIKNFNEAVQNQQQYEKQKNKFQLAVKSQNHDSYKHIIACIKEAIKDKHRNPQQRFFALLLAKDLMELGNESFANMLHDKAGERLTKFCQWQVFAQWFKFPSIPDNYGSQSAQNKQFLQDYRQLLLESIYIWGQKYRKWGVDLRKLQSSVQFPSTRQMKFHGTGQKQPQKQQNTSNSQISQSQQQQKNLNISQNQQINQSQQQSQTPQPGDNDENVAKMIKVNQAIFNQYKTINDMFFGDTYRAIEIYEKIERIIRQINKAKDKYSVVIAEAPPSKEIDFEREKFFKLLDAFELINDQYVVFQTSDNSMMQEIKMNFHAMCEGFIEDYLKFSKNPPWEQQKRISENQKQQVKKLKSQNLEVIKEEQQPSEQQIAEQIKIMQQIEQANQKGQGSSQKKPQQKSKEEQEIEEQKKIYEQIQKQNIQKSTTSSIKKEQGEFANFGFESQNQKQQNQFGGFGDFDNNNKQNQKQNQNQPANFGDFGDFDNVNQKSDKKSQQINDFNQFQNFGEEQDSDKKNKQSSNKFGNWNEPTPQPQRNSDWGNNWSAQQQQEQYQQQQQQEQLEQQEKLRKAEKLRQQQIEKERQVQEEKEKEEQLKREIERLEQENYQHERDLIEQELRAKKQQKQQQQQQQQNQSLGEVPQWGDIQNADHEEENNVGQQPDWGELNQGSHFSNQNSNRKNQMGSQDKNNFEAPDWGELDQNQFQNQSQIQQQDQYQSPNWGELNQNSQYNSDKKRHNLSIQDQFEQPDWNIKDEGNDISAGHNESSGDDKIKQMLEEKKRKEEEELRNYEKQLQLEQQRQSEQNQNIQQSQITPQNQSNAQSQIYNRQHSYQYDQDQSINQSMQNSQFFTNLGQGQNSVHASNNFQNSQVQQQPFQAGNISQIHPQDSNKNVDFQDLSVEMRAFFYQVTEKYKRPNPLEIDDWSLRELQQIVGHFKTLKQQFPNELNNIMNKYNSLQNSMRPDQSQSVYQSYSETQQQNTQNSQNPQNSQNNQNSQQQLQGGGLSQYYTQSVNPLQQSQNQFQDSFYHDKSKQSSSNQELKDNFRIEINNNTNTLKNKKQSSNSSSNMKNSNSSMNKINAIDINIENEEAVKSIAIERKSSENFQQGNSNQVYVEPNVQGKDLVIQDLSSHSQNNSKKIKEKYNWSDDENEENQNQTQNQNQNNQNNQNYRYNKSTINESPEKEDSVKSTEKKEKVNFGFGDFDDDNDDNNNNHKNIDNNAFGDWGFQSENQHQLQNKLKLDAWGAETEFQGKAKNQIESFDPRNQNEIHDNQEWEFTQKDNQKGDNLLDEGFSPQKEKINNSSEKQRQLEIARKLTGDFQNEQILSNKQTNQNIAQDQEIAQKLVGINQQQNNLQKKEYSPSKQISEIAHNTNINNTDASWRFEDFNQQQHNYQQQIQQQQYQTEVDEEELKQQQILQKKIELLKQQNEQLEKQNQVNHQLKEIEKEEVRQENKQFPVTEEAKNFDFFEYATENQTQYKVSQEESNNQAQNNKNNSQQNIKVHEDYEFSPDKFPQKQINYAQNFDLSQYKKTSQLLDLEDKILESNEIPQEQKFLILQKLVQRKKEVYKLEKIELQQSILSQAQQNNQNSQNFQNNQNNEQNLMDLELEEREKGVFEQNNQKVENLKLLKHLQETQKALEKLVKEKSEREKQLNQTELEKNSSNEQKEYLQKTVQSLQIDIQEMTQKIQQKDSTSNNYQQEFLELQKQILLMQEDLSNLVVFKHEQEYFLDKFGLSPTKERFINSSPENQENFAQKFASPISNYNYNNNPETSRISPSPNTNRAEIQQENQENLENQQVQASQQFDPASPQPDQNSNQIQNQNQNSTYNYQSQNIYADANNSFSKHPRQYFTTAREVQEMFLKKEAQSVMSKYYNSPQLRSKFTQELEHELKKSQVQNQLKYNNEFTSFLYSSRNTMELPKWREINYDNFAFSSLFQLPIYQEKPTLLENLKKSCLLNQSVWLQNLNIQIGIQSKFITENLGLQTKLIMELIFLNQTEDQDLAITLKFQNRNLAISPGSELPSPLIVPQNGQLTHKIIISHYDLTSPQLPIVELFINEENIVMPLPASINKFMQFAFIDNHSFKTKWNIIKGACIQSAPRKPNTNLVRNLQEFKMYFNELVDIQSRKYPGAVYKIGGLIRLNGVNEFLLKIKAVNDGEIVFCISSYQSQQKLSEQIVNFLCFAFTFKFNGWQTSQKQLQSQPTQQNKSQQPSTPSQHSQKPQKYSPYSSPSPPYTYQNSQTTQSLKISQTSHPQTPQPCSSLPQSKKTQPATPQTVQVLQLSAAKKQIHLGTGT
ncbi:hypothetical protein PPERSA_01971 [Pseudocohnilembus persalinus]|uniref:Uncharacterized protein n=1 Tax=Pseudocohnilembus persalinus TaxID=266149 RepID=A0A0V0QF67_PSEPJ|nr:hypothetical protein PPERSA_01971 [Pseudocohnilembus persalinus]|eukprot:KRX00792.1 hypothetical protein PPERSA_01971 [Pseudocohnilembus persalinus]